MIREAVVSEVPLTACSVLAVVWLSNTDIMSNQISKLFCVRSHGYSLSAYIKITCLCCAFMHLGLAYKLNAVVIFQLPIDYRGQESRYHAYQPNNH